MDVFSRTFLPATAEAGLSIPTVSRHLPVLRRCVTPEDVTLLVSRCHRVDQPISGTHLLLITNRSFVVTRESRLLRRVSLHLATDLRHLSDVMWTPYPRLPALEFAATVVDGVRERFWLRVGDPRRLSRLESLLGNVFHTQVAVPAKPQLLS